MQQFESKKKNFTSVPASRRQIKLSLVMPELIAKPGETAGYNKTYSQILITHEELMACFEPVMNTILNLVNSQVASVKKGGNPAIGTIALVGGLGESSYVCEKLIEWGKENSIRLTTPWSGG
jgi:hypothetical protein